MVSPPIKEKRCLVKGRIGIVGGIKLVPVDFDLIECAANEVCVPNSSEEKDMAIPSVELG